MAKAKSTPTRALGNAPILRTSPRGKHRRVPTIGEELEGEKKKERHSKKVNNEKNVGKSVTEPTGGKEPPPAKRPNLRGTTQAMSKKNTLRSSSPLYVVPTKHDVVLPPNKGKYYSRDEDEECNKEENEDAGNNKEDGNKEENDNEDEEYGNDKDKEYGNNKDHSNGSPESHQKRSMGLGPKVISPSRNQDSSSGVGHEAQVPNCNQ
jgi:hypothetical protein